MQSVLEYLHEFSRNVELMFPPEDDGKTYENPSNPSPLPATDPIGIPVGLYLSRQPR